MEASSGKTTVLVGPSGCGKSTVLNLMLGLIEIDGGSLTFNDHPISAVDRSELRRSIGYVIQSGGLFPHLSAAGNATLMARYYKWSKSEIDHRLETLAALVQLPMDLLKRFPVELSGGQRQRVALMRALFLDPPVLLMDEPFGALDTLVRHDLQEDLKALFADLSKTVVIVTHDMAEAAFFADHIVLLNEGRVAQSGSIDALVNTPASDFVMRFLTARRTLQISEGVSV